MKSEVFTIARGGYAIPTRRWSPDGAPRAVVQIAHGLAEHSARYERLALALTKAGYVVVANDHRGHGPNCRPADLGFFADAGGWRECLDDLEAVAHGVAADFPGLPLVFFGHSMGSFLGQTHIAEHGAELAAAILSGTSGPPAAMLPIGRGIAGFERWRLGPRGKSPLVQSLLFGELNKPSKPARTPFDWLSRDPAEVDIYISDPLLYFGPTLRFRGHHAAGDRPCGRSRRPRLAGNRGARSQGVADLHFQRLARSRRSQAAGPDRRLSRGAASTRVTAKLYTEARHETLNEINRAEVTADLVAWLDANVR